MRLHPETSALANPEPSPAGQRGSVSVTDCWASGNVRLYLGDCRAILPTIEDVALVLTDPPYGIAYDTDQNKQQDKQTFAAVLHDDEHFSPAHLLEYRDVILWGCNNYCDGIPPKIGQWYFWDKVTQNGQKVRIAEGEYAWHKRGTKPRAFRHLWSGAYRASEAGERSVHPTQKPVQLMQWCLDVADVAEGAVVCDPYMGSGTTGIACIRTGRGFVGIEKDPAHYATALERIQRELAQGNLFLDSPNGCGEPRRGRRNLKMASTSPDPMTAPRTTRTHDHLKARLHKALFGETFGYDLEHASTITPAVLADAKRLGLLTDLRRLRRPSPSSLPHPQH